MKVAIGCWSHRGQDDWRERFSYTPSRITRSTGGTQTSTRMSFPSAVRCEAETKPLAASGGKPVVGAAVTKAGMCLLRESVTVYHPTVWDRARRSGRRYPC